MVVLNSKGQSKLNRAMLLTLLFVSGASSLIYESLWIRLLSLGVGSTAISISLVLTFFFLGLSLGSSWIAKRIDRLERPLRVYSLLELGIAAYAAVLFFILFQFHEVLAILPFQSHEWIGTIAKFALAGVLLLPPSFAMGATLPLVLQAVERGGSAKNAVSLVYGINTLGALVGAVSTGFLLIPFLGIDGANYVAIAGNVLVTMIGLGLAKSESLVGKTEVTEDKFSFQWTRDLPILGLCAVCGFVSLSTEVVWSKYLGIFLGNNIYGLSIVLGLYLLGIGLGSLLVPLMKRLPISQTQLFIVLALLVTASIGVTSRLLDAAPVASEVLMFYSGERVDEFVIRAVISGALLFFPTLFFGALFPLAIDVWSTKIQRSNARILGLAYAVNTVGGILGSFLTGIVAMPLVGSANSLKILVVLMAGSAIYVALRLDENRVRKYSYAAVAASFALIFIFIQPFRFKNILKSAYPRTVAAPSLKDALHPFTKGFEDYKQIIEGETALISLSYDPKDGPNYRRFLRLKTNGLNESIYDSQDKERLPRYEGLLGALPYLFTKNPQSAFVVGYGGGFTVDFLTLTNLKKVDVVELEKGILEAADYVHRGKNPILNRPNLSLKIEDARFVLATRARGPYDFIVSQPSHSWLSGVANLFTEEFFVSVQKNLTPHGVFSQWLNLYNMDETVLKSILRTFYTVFPHGAVFTQFNDTEMILLGSREPLQLQQAQLDEILGRGATQRRLVGVPLRSAAELLGYYSLSREQALALAGDAPFNTDRNAFAETRQSRLFYQRKQVLPQSVMQAAYEGDFETLDVDFGTHAYDLLVALSDEGQVDKFQTVLARYETTLDGKLSGEDLGRFALLLWKAGRFEETVRYGEKAFKYTPTTESLNLLLAGLSGTGDHARIFSLAAKYPKLRDRLTDCYVARSHLEKGTETRIAPVFAKMEREIPQYTNACGVYFNRILGSYFLKVKRPEVAATFLDAYLVSHPEDHEANRQRAIAHLELGEVEQADGIISGLPRG